MSVARTHVCLECGKTIHEGAEGIAKHYVPAEGGCPAMELRAINWTLKNDPPRGEGAAERIATLKRRRISLTLRASDEGRGDSVASEVPSEVSEAVQRILETRNASVSEKLQRAKRNRLATAPGT